MRVRRMGSAGVLIATMIATVTLAPAPAQAKAKTTSVLEYGTVVSVPDGDTIDVVVDGVQHRIRFAGIQAMEQHTYSSNLDVAEGECHALEATARLRDILGGRRVLGRQVLLDGARVRLTARDASSSSLGRQVRHVAIRMNGKWQDVGALLVRDGHAIPAYHAVEYTHNKRYRVLARQAAAAHRGIWNRDSCGARPAPSAALAVGVLWDAPGDDSKNVNGEYIRVVNNSAFTIRMGGWWVRDSGLRRYTFPSSVKLKPGRSVVVHVGKGRTETVGRTLHLYWGLSAPIFENVTGSPTYLGDGAYLFDPVGNLRAWKQYGKV